MNAVRALGCICCRKLGGFALPQIHHVISGGRRMGHMSILPLCPWHHQGYPPQGYTDKQATDLFGPSLANGSKPFVRHWGSEAELLDEVAELLGREAA